MANQKNWLIASNLHYRLPDGRALYSDLDLSLGPGITALIGDNGAGKSTLAAQLAGLQTVGGGGEVQRHGHIALLRQQGGRPAPGTTLADYLALRPLFSALQRIAEGSCETADFDSVDERWDLPERLTDLLHQLGLPPLTPWAPIDHMSGGELTRLALIRLLLQQPDHMILDEPGNHLDQDARGRLLSMMREFKGGILLISHDRQLLQHADTLLDLGPWGLRQFHGNYSDYRTLRLHQHALEAQAVATERHRLQRQRMQAQANLEKHQRREAMGRANRRSGSQSTLLLDRQAQRSERTRGRLRRLAQDRLQQSQQRLQKAIDNRDPARRARLAIGRVSFRSSHRPQLHCDALQFRYQDRQPLIERFSLQLATGERMALCGPNGCGKSTLLKLFSGELSPQSGHVHRQGAVARLDQHLSLLSPQQGALENFRRLAPGLAQHDYYARLDAMGLSRQWVEMPSGQLSGGERVRLALACLLLGPQPVPLLLLDEPTNHLDLSATEALTHALQDYAGSLIVASHDRQFITELGIDHVLDMAPQDPVDGIYTGRAK